MLDDTIKYNKNFLDKPIKRLGVFDSGIGGLSIVETLKSFALDEIIYFADTAHLPYGTKTEAFIQSRCEIAIEALLKQDVDCIIIGCHTASSVINMAQLREKYKAPIIDITTPSVYETINSNSIKSVGVMATPITIKKHSHKNLLNKKTTKMEVVERECNDLASLIEHRKIYSPPFTELLKKYTKALSEKSVDSILLGCTHYIFISEEIQKLMAVPIKFIDGRLFIKELINMNCDGKKTEQPDFSILVTGNAKLFEDSLKFYTKLRIKSIKKT